MPVRWAPVDRKHQLIVLNRGHFGCRLKKHIAIKDNRRAFKDPSLQNLACTVGEFLQCSPAWITGSRLPRSYVQCRIMATLVGFGKLSCVARRCRDCIGYDPRLMMKSPGAPSCLRVPECPQRNSILPDEFAVRELGVMVGRWHALLRVPELPSPGPSSGGCWASAETPTARAARRRAAGAPRHFRASIKNVDSISGY